VIVMPDAVGGILASNINTITGRTRGRRRTLR
jgi:hypothetical protein